MIEIIVKCYVCLIDPVFHCYYDIIRSPASGVGDSVNTSPMVNQYVSWRLRNKLKEFKCSSQACKATEGVAIKPEKHLTFNRCALFCPYRCMPGRSRISSYRWSRTSSRVTLQRKPWKWKFRHPSMSFPRRHTLPCVTLCSPTFRTSETSRPSSSHR